MIFNTKEELNLFIKKLIYIGEGTQGKCYLDKNNLLVYKFFWHCFLEDEFDLSYFSEDDILKFSHLKANTIIFPKEVIYLDKEVIGYTTRYRNAPNLYKLNPLNLSLDRLTKLIEIALKEIIYLSKKGVCMYDVLYNVLLGRKIYIIDTLEYTLRSGNYADILRHNLKAFNIEIMSFLIDGIFDGVINNNKSLNDMYHHKDLVSLIDFINELRSYLSKILAKDITYLKEAKSLQDTQVDEEALYYERSELIRQKVIKSRNGD